MRRSTAGFSLVELMAALAVLTIGLLGSVSLYYFGMDKMKAARETSTAMRAARNEIEYWRAQPFDSLRAGSRDVLAAGERDLADLPNARAAVTIDDEPAAPGRLKRVSVSIAWTGENGRTVRKGAATLIAARVAP